MYTFISAERYNLTKAENDRRTNTLERYLENQGLQFDHVCGVYGGVAEMSFRVHGHFPDALAVADYFNQESILVVYPDDSAVLHYVDGRQSQSIGKFREVDEFEARKHEGYSIINNKYYLAA